MIKAYDLHANIGIDKVYGFSQTPESLLKKMQMAEVEKAVLQPIPLAHSDVQKINDYVAAIVEKYPDKFIGFCCVCPSDPKVTVEIDRAVNDLRLKGILLDYDTFLGVVPKPKIEPIFEKAHEHQIPVLIQNLPGQSKFLGDNLAEDINTIAELFPDISIIVHQMIPAINYFLKKNSNLLLETAQNLGSLTIEMYKDIIGVHRILFGSNSPKEHPLINRINIDEARIKESEKELILRGNLSKLLGI
ncbi:amidohydrolase family protein [[Eubacterium] cellulosolvens]